MHFKQIHAPSLITRAVMWSKILTMCHCDETNENYFWLAVELKKTLQWKEQNNIQTNNVSKYLNHVEN